MSLIRLPSQYADEFDNFLNKLNLTIELITQEGLKIENVLSQFSLSQVINKLTYISQNFNSCIDLLFTNQQNLITDSGIYPSLHSNCHHQIIYGKFNLKIFYPPRYERHI